MTNIHTIWARRVVIGAALATFAAACSDAPVGPWPTRQEGKTERAVDLVKDDYMRTETSFAAARNEVITHREMRARDGQLYVIEAIRDDRGLPREIRVSRNGQSVARLSNAWRRTAAGYVLEHQRMTPYASGRASAMVDSRSGGDLVALAGGPIVVRAQEAGSRGAEAAGVRLSLRRRSLEVDGSTDAGRCDAEARAVEEAIDDWLYSVVAVAGATVTANPILTWTAYAYQLKKYRDLTRKEAALDQCVAEAGKPVDEM